MNCPACGKDTVDGAAFCQHCGARLGGCCPICGNPAKTMVYWGIAY